MAGLPPQYNSSPFGQFGSGTEAYGMANGPMGYGQGFNGIPMGYLGSLLGGAPGQGASGKGGISNPILGGVNNSGGKATPPIERVPTNPISGGPPGITTPHEKAPGLGMGNPKGPGIGGGGGGGGGDGRSW